ncbi:hypothetical protein ABH931_000159 [Streptacidiphilus sp. MAP12-33]|uniref:hypothetical protein n=1 Tax=Streptacidiphilus sp. MAP12-33 TaxID=3156266 RepID=UPI0035186FE7
MQRRGVVGALVVTGALVAGVGVWASGGGGGPAVADQQAQAVVKAVQGDLNTGFYAPGSIYGGLFSQGTLVEQVERHGGVLVSMASDRTRTVNQGVVLMDVQGKAACYALSFGLGAWTVRVTWQRCPADADLAVARGLLDHRLPDVAPVAPGQYAEDGAGVRALLLGTARTAQTGSDGASSASSAVLGVGTADGVLSAAARIRGVCYFVRMGGAAAAQSTVPLWQAPLDDQRTCGQSQAAAASGTYGEDAAQEG